MPDSNIGAPGALLGAIILGNEFQAESGPPVGPPAGVIGETTQYDGYRTKQGDTGVVFTDTLTYSDGSPADLTGAIVQFVVRNLASASPVILTGSGTVTSATAGDVQYSPSPQDTAVPGDFTACWVVTFATGQVMTFPSVGYIDVTIEPGVAGQAQLLVD